MCAPLGEKGDAIGIWHPDIEQYQIRAKAIEFVACLRSVTGRIHLVTFVFEDFADDAPNIGLIVDD